MHLVSVLPASRPLLCPQLAHLSSLSSLRVEYCSMYGPDSLAPLARLASSLRRLSINDTCLPACLAQLTGLEQLLLYQYVDQQMAGVAAALPALAQLTALGLVKVAMTDELCGALDSLPALQRLWQCHPASTSSGTPWGQPRAWLGRVRHLALSFDDALLNTSLLSAATQLERMFLLGTCAPRGWSKAWRSLLQWAEHQAPALQHIEVQLAVQWDGTYVSPVPARSVLSGLKALQRRQPQLHCGVISPEALREFEITVDVPEFLEDGADVGF